MQPQRKPWQHKIETLSEDQLRELIHILGWEVDKFGKDYGEDFFVRIFDNGNPSRNVFYVQLKGTRDVEQYSLNTGDLSYPIEVITLKQWYSYSLPVLLIVWDVEHRQGYWVHIQAFITDKLKMNSKWLDDANKRQIHIPSSQVFSEHNIQSLYQAIDAEFAKIELGKQHLEASQQERIASIDQNIAPRQDSELSGAYQTVPPHVQQQLKLAQFELTLINDPTNVDALLGKAEILYELHEMDKALITVNKLWELKKDDPRIALVRGCIFAEYAIAHGKQPQSMLYEAIDLFKSASSITPPALLNYNIGNVLTALGKHQEAIEKYDLALSMTPPKHLAAQIWKNRGTCFYHLDNHEEEISSYKNALAQDPNLWEAYSSWAVTELHLKHLESAKTLLLDAFKANPSLTESHYALAYTLAHTLWKLDDTTESYQWVNQVLHANPNHKNARRLKALVLSQLWRENSIYRIAAIPFFKDALLDNPNDVMAQTELYLLYQEEGAETEANALLGDEIDLNRIPPELLYDCAIIFQKEGKHDRAIKFLEAAFERNQEHHIVHKLGHLKKDAGDYRKAIDYYKLALRGVQNPNPILRDIADCYFFLKEYMTCVTMMVKFILGEPQNHEWWTNLAYALIQLKKKPTVLTFASLLLKLQEKQEVSETEIEETVQRLLSKLRKDFGEDFVRRLTTQDILSVI